MASGALTQGLPIVINKITLFIIYFLELTFLLIVIHVQDKYLYFPYC